jgi:hypothetical protein
VASAVQWLLVHAARVVRLKSSLWDTHVCIPTALSVVLRVQGCGVWGVGGWGRGPVESAQC